MVSAEEKSLLESARRNNPDAYTAIFDQFAPMIYRYALRLSGDQMTADNIVGDVFAKMLELFYAGEGPETNLRSYLFESAYHSVVDGSRGSRRSVPLELAIESGDPRNFVDLLENKIMMETVMSAMDNVLTDDQKNVIILRFLEDFSIEETAKIMGKQVGNVKVLQSRGIAKLKERLKGRSVEWA